MKPGQIQIFIIVLSLFGLFPLHTQAKQYDPRLIQVSDLTYQGNINQAKTIIEQYIKDKPQDPNGYYLKGIVLDWQRILKESNNEEVREKIYHVLKKGSKLSFFIWEKDQENPDKLVDIGNGYIFLGRILSDRGSWFQAIMTSKKGPKHLEKALELDPKRTDGLMTLGMFRYVADKTPGAAAPFKALFGIKGSRDQGLDALKNSIKGNHPYQNDGLVALYHVYFLYEKNYPVAHSYLDTLISKFPQNPKFRLLKAEVVEKQNKALSLDSYGQFLAWCQSNAPVCQKHFQYETLFYAGRVAAQLKKPELAKAHLNQAIQLGLAKQPRWHGEALYWLGKSSAQPNEAIKYFDQAEDLDGARKSTRKKAAQAKKDLCSGESQPSAC